MNNDARPVTETDFGNIKNKRPLTSVDSLPTTAEMWYLLRGAYGANLVGATLVAVLDNKGQCTVQTLTFPGPK